MQNSMLVFWIYINPNLKPRIPSNSKLNPNVAEYLRHTFLRLLTPETKDPMHASEP